METIDIIIIIHTNQWRLVTFQPGDAVQKIILHFLKRRQMRRAEGDGCSPAVCHFKVTLRWSNIYYFEGHTFRFLSYIEYDSIKIIKTYFNKYLISGRKRVRFTPRTRVSSLRTWETNRTLSTFMITHSKTNKTQASIFLDL